MSYMTEERKMIQQTARDFSVNEVLPVANKLDPVEGEIPMELRDKMAGLGYFGILIPEEFGGLGLGCFEYALVDEELARGWMSVASIIARGNGSWGDVTDEQRRRIFQKLERRKLPEGCSGTPIRKIGYFGWKTWELHFDNCRIPATTMVGEEGRGFY